MRRASRCLIYLLEVRASFVNGTYSFQSVIYDLIEIKSMNKDLRAVVKVAAA